MPDWGLGRYEITAAVLEPVAQRVVAMSKLVQGDQALDIACGTGNAAIVAARSGAKVTGLDQAPRLIEVALQRAAAEGLDISFVVGDAEQLELADNSFDVAFSIFGMIFCPDPKRAFAEMIRVLRRGGRGFLSVWLPVGAIDEMVGIFTRAVNAATGQTGPPSGLEWSDKDAIQSLAISHDATATFHEGELQFVAESPEAYFESIQDHPMSVGMKPLLEHAGTAASTSAEALKVLRSGNEDPDAFRVTSRYRIIEVGTEA